jgi:hypothetical protein
MMHKEHEPNQKRALFCPQFHEAGLNIRGTMMPQMIFMI